MDADQAPRDEVLLRRAYEGARDLHAGVALARDAFVAGARARLRDRIAALGLEPTPERLAEAAERLCHADLYLVLACDAGNDAAWTQIHAAYSARLMGLAAKRGFARDRAHDAVSELLADLALPPATSSHAATRLGTYRGTGSLFAWLATTLVRRIAGAARRKQPAALAEEQAEARPGVRSDPGARAAGAETTSLLEGVLREGMAQCSARERLVLVMKHRDALAHRDIAAVLGVGVPRVSQLLRQAQEKLAAVARTQLPDGVDADAWPEAVATAARALAKSGAAAEEGGTP